VPMGGIGPDGHPERGDFLPPVPFPRRMWAGGELGFKGDFRVGELVTRRSVVEDVAQKTGRSGEMVFVTVRHHYSTPRGLALDERQDIVYRGLGSESPSNAGTSAPAPGSRKTVRTIRADPVLLFRYSAITFNGHRIHYDHPYVTGKEGYPGLIVHGPLLATLLLDLLRRNAPGADVATFRFRAVRPTFDLHPFQVNGETGDDGTVRLWSQDHEGWLTMDAVATLR